ncbi:HTH-type transcriptional regulator PuuR [Rhodococcus sp. AD45]|nr:HTH-type transcriptional regulator PuuR [Rhodococcus sp. AD45]
MYFPIEHVDNFLLWSILFRACNEILRSDAPPPHCYVQHMDDDQVAIATAIGIAVRHARKEAGLTMREVALKSGLSQPFLSQTENGRAVPSVMNLHRLAQSLGTTAHALLAQGERTPSSLVRAHEGRKFELAHDSSIRFCSTGSHTMEPNEITAGPHSEAGEHTEHAGEEFIHVLEGTVDVEVGLDERHRLNVGDTLLYAATIPHRWFNRTDRIARFLIVSSPPSF